jgi:hypothetical protein
VQACPEKFGSKMALERTIGQWAVCTGKKKISVQKVHVEKKPAGI